GSEFDWVVWLWLILHKPLENNTNAANMLILKKTVRAAADNFGDRLERRLRRQTLWHNRRYVAAGPGEGLRQVRKQPLQTKPHNAVVGREQLVGRVHQRVDENYTQHETTNAGNNILRQ